MGKKADNISENTYVFMFFRFLSCILRLYKMLRQKEGHVFVMQPFIKLKSFLLMSAQAKLLEKNSVYLPFFS